MLNGFRIVCVTPAGRRRYMRLLVPQILSEDVVDEYQIWMNTEDQLDLLFLNELAQIPKVKLVPQPRGIVDGAFTICEFFAGCVDQGTIYIRFDDDIVWIEPGSIRALAETRIRDTESFLVSAAVVNNAVFTNMFQVLGLYDDSQYVHAHAFDEFGWKSGPFAESLHRHALELIGRNQLSTMQFEPRMLAQVRFSINCISWRGDMFSTFAGQVDREEEEFLSVVKPCRMGAVNKVDGRAIVCHFAFYTQRDYLDRTDLLACYLEQVANAAWVRDEFRGAVEQAFVKAEELASKAAERDQEGAAGSSILSRLIASLRFPYLRFRIEWMASADYKRRLVRKFRNWPLIRAGDA
ncbi:hypothetical protein [Parvibaculum sp.]|uniref:hypothetical protein n=1 Tax=Parvibaculum sp. TaxID=2024848 RepID=UPI00320C2A63